MKKIILSLCLVSGLFILAGYESDLNAAKRCTMDIQCGVGKKCVSGVCTGGISPKVKGNCVKGRFGKKVCDNTGKECNNSSECWN